MSVLLRTFVPLAARAGGGQNGIDDVLISVTGFRRLLGLVLAVRLGAGLVGSMLNNGLR
jgi:hypothetical protein